MDKQLIQRLALQAGFSGPSDSSVDSDDPERNLVTVRSEYGIGVELARFAALVVEECAKLCDAHAAQCGPLMEEGVAAQELADAIRDAFPKEPG